MVRKWSLCASFVTFVVIERKKRKGAEEASAEQGTEALDSALLGSFLVLSSLFRLGLGLGGRSGCDWSCCGSGYDSR